MENYKLVLRGDLNQNGYLFGGNLLKWVDEYAWIAASLDYPDCSFVTIALDNVVFKKSIGEGSILKFEIDQEKTGRSSICYKVNVFCRKDCQEKLMPVFSTHVTFVNINEKGEKALIL